ncbi:MAG TPA: DUF1552 domain-containing protein [Candidatus Acidoferrum sp.]|jgi:hypothetical protein|nr:DUF1552 domain-containing protein [Candidatus Acidoferrum sp.]
MKTNDALNRSRGFHPAAGLTRRQFLRGLGACLALPAFESLGPGRVLAAENASGAGLATTSSGSPLRTAFVYFPNGAIQSAWWPKNEGGDFEFSRTLAPLEPGRRSIQILGGLDHHNAEPGPDGAGDHARANGTFLTGARMKKSAADIHAAISIDQVIARGIGHLTRLPSLELTCDYERASGACDSGYSCAYQYNLSWSSPTTPMAPEHNPRLVFERLFGAGSASERAENLKRRQAEQRSILDFVLEDARGMQRRLNPGDREKLDQYLTGVREVETRIQGAERFGSLPDPGMETPAGVPADYGQFVQTMYDLLAVAFHCDMTRVATLLLAHDGSNRSFAEVGIPEGHHDLSHHFDDAEKIRKVSEIDLWYVKQFARFLEKLENTKDVDGNSLLRNSMIVYGGGNADGNRHTHTNLPIVLAGGGGGTLKPGRYIRQSSQPMSNLFLSLAERMGLSKLERFGDSTGRLKDV